MRAVAILEWKTGRSRDPGGELHIIPLKLSPWRGYSTTRFAFQIPERFRHRGGGAAYILHEHHQTLSSIFNCRKYKTHAYPAIQ